MFLMGLFISSLDFPTGQIFIGCLHVPVSTVGFPAGSRVISSYTWLRHTASCLGCPLLLPTSSHLQVFPEPSPLQKTFLSLDPKPATGSFCSGLLLRFLLLVAGSVKPRKYVNFPACHSSILPLSCSNFQFHCTFLTYHCNTCYKLPYILSCNVQGTGK